MKFQRICRNCQHNFGGFCLAKGLGAEIKSDDESCEFWEICQENLVEIVDSAVWYLKNPYLAGKLNLNDFLEKIEQDAENIPVYINIYDAIEEIFGVNQQKIAEILSVSPDVIGYAKAHGTVERRISHFSEVLCIPEDLFRNFTSVDLPILEQSFQQFLMKNSEEK